MDHNFSSGCYSDREDDRPISRQLNKFDVLAETSSEVDPPEDLDLSDEVLNYINHILMEEDLEDKICMFQDSSALEATEKSLYELLGEHHHPSSIYHDQLVPNLDQTPYYDNSLVPDDCHTDPNQLNVSASVISQSTSQSSYNSSSSSSGTIIDGPMDFSVTTPKIPDIFSDNESATQFRKGVEEARKFLPSGGSSSNFIYMKYDESVEKKFDNVGFYDSSRGKRNIRYDESIGLQEERKSKQSAVYFESIVSPDMFDEVLLGSGGLNESGLRKVTKSRARDDATTHSKGSSGSGKKQAGKKNVVDLRSLLTLCAQSIAADDYRSANEFLKQIRRHSTPTGDGMQRLAHYFADGLETRMAGSDHTRIHKSIPNMPASASNALKAYRIYLATCPFRKISNFFANKTIMNVSENATRLHIIDFGILYGFQWPSFLQRLSTRPGGPPRLRITGIDFPCRGFRPSERVEETGRRLASYAESFGVPFEFNAIAQKWETIKLEDVKMEEDELVVVNSLFRLRNLLDESVVVKSPRNMVLNLIRKMNPAVFVLGIMNGAYNGPFFSTRFREALFHYSAIFDMLDANIPREVHERMLVEKVVFGRQAMNVIACEGGERIERPETYKQWQVRNMRAGFDQLPLDKEIMEMARNKVKSWYHKDFVIDEDEDGVWMLQGWKGRIIYALSSWRPTNY